jgi:hypothetical protein
MDSQAKKYSGPTPKFARKYHERSINHSSGCSSCRERGKALPEHVKEAIRNSVKNF